MQVDSDPLQIKDANYIELREYLMVEATKSPDIEMDVSKPNFVEKVKEIYLPMRRYLLLSFFFISFLILLLSS